MRLDLRNIIHVPDAEKTFQYQMDLSDLDFWGRKPITRPVSVEGSVTNHAGALVLSGTARSELDLVCDRCGKECGADLNLGPCGCRPDVDPRWAALAQLLDDES